MDSFDDEILHSFVEQSRDRLADVENDLLAPAAGVEDVLTNKAFRAVRSIKRGAGFMGLETVKTLAHKTENVLWMIRGQEIRPTSDVIEILRMSFDKLRDMMNHINESNSEDVTECTAALAGLSAAHLPPEDKHTVTEHVEISLPSGPTVFTVSRFDLRRAEEEDHAVLLVEFDIIHDIHQHGMTPLVFLKGLQDHAAIIDCTVEIDDAGSLDDEGIVSRLPLYVLMSTGVLPGHAPAIFGVTPEQVFCLTRDLVLKAVDCDGFEIIAPPAGMDC